MECGLVIRDSRLQYNLVWYHLDLGQKRHRHQEPFLRGVLLHSNSLQIHPWVSILVTQLQTWCQSLLWVVLYDYLICQAKIDESSCFICNFISEIDNWLISRIRKTSSNCDWGKKPLKDRNEIPTKRDVSRDTMEWDSMSRLTSHSIH